MRGKFWCTVALAGLGILFSTEAGARILCFLKGHYLSGTNRICVYDCAGSERYETVGAVQLCPLNVEQ